MGIDNFFGSRNQVSAKVNKQKANAKSKHEERLLEMEYLKPDKLPPYVGEVPDKSQIKKQSVKLVFHNENEIEQFKRHFRVPNYIEPSVTNIEVLVALLDELDSGRIEYDKKSGKIKYNY